MSTSTKKRAIDGNIKTNSSSTISDTNTNDIYVSLLRGINVGGSNRITKEQLVTVFDSIGCSNITTYIQSGNIVFTSNVSNKLELTSSIKSTLINKYHIDVIVYVFTQLEWIEMLNLMLTNRENQNIDCNVTKIYKGKTLKVVTEYMTVLSIDSKSNDSSIGNDGDNNINYNENIKLLNEMGVVNSDTDIDINNDKIKDTGYCILNTTISNDYMLLYTYTPKGILESKFNNSLFEKYLNKTNLNTKSCTNAITKATTRNINTIQKINDIILTIKSKL